MTIAGLMNVRGKAALRQNQSTFEVMDLRIDEEIERLEGIIKDDAE